MTQQEVVEFWVNKAKDDLEVAVLVNNSGKYLHTGFMCHQCIEKALKAYYVHVYNERQPHQHNLEKLAELSSLFDKMDNDKKGTLKKLKPLYIATRYEDDKEDVAATLTKVYCKLLLSETEVLLAWILDSMKLLNNSQDE